MEKAKVAEGVKESVRQNYDRNKQKRGFGSSGSGGNVQKRARQSGPNQAGRPMAANQRPAHCNRCGKSHWGGCWTGSAIFNLLHYKLRDARLVSSIRFAANSGRQDLLSSICSTANLGMPD